MVDYAEITIPEKSKKEATKESLSSILIEHYNAKINFLINLQTLREILQLCMFFVKLLQKVVKLNIFYFIYQKICIFTCY